MTASAQAKLHERLKHVLSERIAEDLRQAPRSYRIREREVPPELVSRQVASTFILVLNWWAESHRSLSAHEVDGLFRSLTVPTLAAILD